MERKHIIAAAAAFALTTTAALAQDRAGPDFSPMKPRNLDDTQSQSQAQPSYDAQYERAPGTADLAPGAPTSNRMLEAYEQSGTSSAPDAPLASGEPATRDYAPPRRATVTPPTPRQSTIGNGLFDRRGPNDFGA